MNKKILFLGVGGIGVSALAIAAKKLGATVAGYDGKSSKLTAKLESLGVNVFSNPLETDVEEYDMVVYSSAIKGDHPLLSKARQFNILCLQRAMFLAILMRDFKYSVAITGTHGKTTTSSVLATLLQQLDRTSSFVVGGVVKHTNSNIDINGTDKLVIEADESDASFLHLDPTSIVVTNIDKDHMSTYKNSYDNLLKNFYVFLFKESVESIYLCLDDKGCQDLLEKYSFGGKKITTYGFANNADAKIAGYQIEDGYTKFSIFYNQQKLDFCTILPGRYNILNITACVVSCLDLGFKYNQIKKALKQVAGVVRRFDIYTKTISSYTVQVIDDYGHHPVEVINCLSAVKDKYPDKKIIHIFQPHRYSRNRDLFDDWPKALAIADKLILLPTYSAGEDIIDGATSLDLSKQLSNCILVEDFSQAISELENVIDDGYVVLVQGAGDITNLVEMLGE
ncbi:UDP-N-acetylmuramate--L-alanine ligase [Allofrancisella inopinata]|uniref:UDP-N-acetylmuramate--L-alanine ligase n=1 Tax=Allofrancisella inopinata TaxID=1085647 RepID=A0AAE6YIT6_9GAMM|nr:UDP-N-acetylmuramate--L-alanine ligase [Allofrancisella inopinata]QIV96688.1 UDP-N-acetylmuramate--L-alanine ligase [Allofrancisella inopinata]TDT73440.1 UDP-N-acetylmuramate--L-alanine ligase [Allofrancisella inopinata]